MKNENGFTLIEMMIVLLVISVLLLITVPNATKNNQAINKKGCEAYVHMVEGQVQAYHLEKGSYPSSIAELSASGFLKDPEAKCPDGSSLTISSGGIVKLSDPAE